MMCEITWIALTAIGTWALAFITLWLVRKQNNISRDQLKVKKQINFDD